MCKQWGGEREGGRVCKQWGGEGDNPREAPGERGLTRGRTPQPRLRPGAPRGLPRASPAPAPSVCRVGGLLRALSCVRVTWRSRFPARRLGGEPLASLTHSHPEARLAATRVPAVASALPDTQLPLDSAGLATSASGLRWLGWRSSGHRTCVQGAATLPTWALLGYLGAWARGPKGSGRWRPGRLGLRWHLCGVWARAAAVLRRGDGPREGRTGSLPFILQLQDRVPSPRPQGPSSERVHPQDLAP